MSQEDISINERVRKRFPDYCIDLSFPICLPIYELRLRVTVLAEHRLSTIARFVLRLARLEVSAPNDILAHLGLPAALVPDVAAELLGLGLVTQRQDLSIEVTEEGERLLAGNGVSMRPQNRHPKLPYDPLTRRVIDIDVEDVIDRSGVRERGLYVVPTRPRRPRLGQIRLDEVQRYCRTYERISQNVDVLEIADIKDVRLKYRPGILLYRLRNNVGAGFRYAAYRDTQYLEEESASLQRLADDGAKLVPREVERSDSVAILSKTSVSKEEFGLLTGIEAADRAVGDLGDRREGDKRGSELRELLHGQTGGKFGLIRTEEHRGVLLRAVREAKSQLTLVSAWISQRAFDEELSAMLRDAILRGVRVRIAWGLGTTRGAENDRNLGAGRHALGRLTALLPSRYRSRLTQRRTETHEKFIICDGTFCAVGSFNWLSYRGEVDEGYRREVSYYTEREEDVRRLTELSDELFGNT